MGLEEPLLDELVEVEGGKFARDPHCFGRFIPSHRPPLVPDEEIHPAPEIVGEHAYRLDRLFEGLHAG